ncbi:MAG: iron(III) transport system substrate-binding protein [Alphaproteobacteria bacterium]|jgi:iron(III) transport system substrate-binding protein|nr:iron(III) transport system substrate-binding protein [Alphaproteobacteria bacterium]
MMISLQACKSKLQLSALFVIGAALLVTPAHAQTNSVADVATYEGADRTQRLLQGSKQEGQLMIYSSVPVEDLSALTDAYEKKYGIKPTIWRSSSEGVLQRIVAESKAKRFEADLVAMAASGMEPLHREKLLQEMKSPVIADLLPQTIPAHREWLPIYLNGFVQAYNTNLVKKESLPKTYQDLLKPEWKGKLAVEGEDYDWFAETVLSLGGEAEGLKLFRDIVAANRISLRSGHTLLANLIVAGEVPLGLTLYNFGPEQLKEKGAPIDWFVIPPAIARPVGMGIFKYAPHPNNAALFLDFCIGEAQPLLASRKFITVTKKIDHPFLKGPVKIIDAGVMLDQAEKWRDLYQKTIRGEAN